MSTETHKKMENMLTETHRKIKTDYELPLSLIESDILPRRPAKSVGRFMCVCKQWKSFLSTPEFSWMELGHVTINDYKLLRLDGHEPPFTFRTLDCEPLKDGSRTDRSIPSPEPSANYVLASLDGLVCLASTEAPIKLAFWNPLTGAYKRLSPIPSYRNSFHVYDIIGFYKDSSNDFKLLYLIMASRGAYIYSHRLDSWQKIEFSVHPHTCAVSWSKLIFRDQYIYFTSPFSVSHNWIICFDVETEKFRKIQCPPVPSGVIDYFKNIVIINGCIHLGVSYTIYPPDPVPGGAKDYHRGGDLWRMEGAGDEWVKVVAFPSAIYKWRSLRVSDSSNGDWFVVSKENGSLKKSEHG